MLRAYLASYSLVLFLSFLFGAVPAFGQALPDSELELRRQEAQQEALRRQNEQRPDVRLQAGALGATQNRLPDETPCFPIKQIRFDGESRFQGLLQASLSGADGDDSPINRCLGAQGINLVLERAREALIGAGFITSAIEISPQDISQGELVFTIIAGRVGKILKAPGADPLPAMLTTFAVVPGEIFNLRDLEQTLENLRRMSSADVRFEIVPGEAIGTSDIVVDFHQKRPWRLGFSLDDSGNRSTGRVLGNLTVGLDNPLGIGDVFYAVLGEDLADRSEGRRGTRSKLLHYSVPFGFWLFSATTTHNVHRQTVFGPFQSYLFWGTSESSEIEVSRTVARTASSRSALSLKGFLRKSGNFIDDTEVLVQRRRSAGWELELQHLQYFRNSVLQLELSYRRGTGAFGAIEAPEDMFGEGTARMRLTNLVLDFNAQGRPLGIPLLYRGRFSAQWNHTPLPVPDRFCIGGRYTVRGFDGEQNLCAVRGQLLRNELAVPLGNWPAQAYVALDAGRVSGFGELPQTSNFLVGTALGIRGQTTIPGSGVMAYDLFVGMPLRKPDAFESRHQVAGFNLSISF